MRLYNIYDGVNHYSHIDEEEAEVMRMAHILLEIAHTKSLSSQYSFDIVDKDLYKKKMKKDDGMEFEEETFENPPKRKQKRHRTTPEQLEVLEESFNVCSTPDLQTRRKLALQLQMSSRRVQIWFQNKRAKLKRNNGTVQKSSTQQSQADSVEDSYQNSQGSSSGNEDDDEEEERLETFEKTSYNNKPSPTLDFPSQKSNVSVRSDLHMSGSYSQFNGIRSQDVSSLPFSFKQSSYASPLHSHGWMGSLPPLQNAPQRSMSYSYIPPLSSGSWMETTCNS